MVKCSALKCPNATYKKTPDITFHRFPKDEILRKAWISNMKMENWQPSSASVICSKHFESHLIDRSGFRTILVHGAIPTIFGLPDHLVPQQINIKSIEAPLASSTTIIDQPSTSHDLYEQPSKSVGTKRSFHGTTVLRELQNLQNIVSPPVSVIHFDRSSTSDVPVECNQDSEASINTTKTLILRVHRSEEEIKKLKTKINLQSKKLKLLKQRNRRLKYKVTKFSDIIKQLKEKEKVSQDDLHILSAINVKNKDLFARFLKKSKLSSVQKSFSPELRSFALQLNFFSPRAYKFVRESFNTVLPHPVTLARWYKKVDAEPGFTSEVFDTLEALAKNSEQNVLVNLSIDEMAIRKGLVWDVSENKYKGYVDTGSDVADDSLPLATQALVILITAINFNWLLPIGYFFVSSLSGEQRANIVKMAITMLNKIKIVVIGLTFDGAASNISMATNLGCDFDLKVLKHFFFFESRKIYVFYDPCHMIKLIRNTFGDFGILIDKDGNKIDFKYLKLLLDLQTKKGLHLGNKLKQAHIMFAKQKMKVSLATQLLSKSVADALSLCEEKFEQFDGCQATIRFLTMINDSFDILNSRSTLAPGYKKALCQANLEITKEMVDNCVDYIMNLKMLNGNLLIHSARKTGFVGFIVCLKSVIHLYQDLVVKEKLRFLPTYKISQDFLEMFFGKMRARGGFNDNPNVVQFRTAYKKNIIRMKLKMQKDGLNIPNPILTVSSSNKAIKTVNISTPSFEKNIMELCDLNEEDVDCFFENVISNPLDEYTSYVTVYIAGFLARKIIKVIQCKICQTLMMGENDNFLCSLINKKDRGGLIYPSKGLINIVHNCEKFIKITKDENINYNSMILYIADLLNNNKELKYDDYHDANHLYLLIKIIVKFYLDLRMKHNAKQNNITERNYLKKIILFKNQ